MRPRYCATLSQRRSQAAAHVQSRARGRGLVGQWEAGAGAGWMALTLLILVASNGTKCSTHRVQVPGSQKYTGGVLLP
jgi:hypothetical protein